MSENYGDGGERHLKNMNDHHRMVGGKRVISLPSCIIFILLLGLILQVSAQDYTITKFESEIKLDSDSLCIAQVTERVTYIFNVKTKQIIRKLPQEMPFGNNVEQVSAIIVSPLEYKVSDVGVYKSPTNSKSKFIQVDFSTATASSEATQMSIEYKYSIRGPFFTFNNSSKFLWSIGNEPAQSIGGIQVSVTFPTTLLSNIKYFGSNSIKNSTDGPETTTTFKSSSLKSMETFTSGFTASNMIFNYCKTTVHNPNVPVAMATIYGPVIAFMLVALLIKAIVDNVEAYRAEKRFEQERHRIGKDIQLTRGTTNQHTDDSELSYGSEEESHENQTLLSKTNKAFNEL